MHRDYLVSSIALLLLFLQPRSQQFVSQSAPARTGTIGGRVIDEAGRPLAGAKVFADPVAAMDVPIGKLHFVTTDENGRFTLGQVVPGINLVCASKEEDLYPDTCAAAFALDLNALPRVRVSEGQTSESVTVRLAKGAKLKGMIVDGGTSEPVKDSRIRLSRRDNPSLFVSTGPDEQARFEFVIPSKPFRIEVSAVRYKAWSSDEHGGDVLLEPESVKEVTVRLQK